MLHAVIRERDDALSRIAALEPEGPGATVVVTYFDLPAYVEQAIDSALGQTAFLEEVIVVDDGSPDRVAAEACRIRAARGDPVRYVRVTNRGLPSARNAGVALARSASVVPLDADDWLEPTFLARTVPALRAGADVVLTGLQEHGLPPRDRAYAPGFGVPLSAVDEAEQWRMNRLWYCALFRRSLLLEVGGWNGRMTDGFEDWDLWIDLLRRGARLEGVEDVLFNYRTRRDGMLATISDALRAEILIEMRRHHGVNVV